MNSSLHPVPKLTDLVNDPAKVSLLPAEAVPELLGDLERLKATLWARLTVPQSNEQSTPEEDRLLDVDEAAVRLGMKPATLYRRAKKDAAIKAMIVDNGTRKLLFSSDKIQSFLRRRTGR